MTYACPSCGSNELEHFYRIEQVPVHSVLLFDSREAALTYPTGDIDLGFCHQCGFISNLVFDPELHEYSEKYEPTQGYSPTFNQFQRQLVQSLIARHNLRNKSVIEIGCGQGEFLTLLCELGPNQGLGFDPAYKPERTSENNPNITFIRDFYSEKYTHHRADFFACKMTLEHIPNTRDFVQMVRRSLEGQPDTLVFFQVPDIRRILEEVAFWDIYYEHCSYFSLGSLARLFTRAGFDVLSLAREYDDQYLMIEAKPGQGQFQTDAQPTKDLAELTGIVSQFRQRFEDQKVRWQSYLQQQAASGKKTIIWGGGSKGVAFLTTLGIRDEIQYAVDINPHKHGTFLAGTGQEIVSPTFLTTYQPDTIIVMNPIYIPEIRHQLTELGLAPTIRAITDVPDPSSFEERM